MSHASTQSKSPVVSVIMGSQSDWETMENASQTLAEFEIPHENKIISAHRTPERLYDYARSARKNGLKVIIAGAGGAAHLPGMVAAITPLPVLGVPVASHFNHGLDSLLSIVQMPGGVPVPTLAVGKPGAKNAALSAVSILALENEHLAERLEAFRRSQSAAVKETPA